LPDLKARAIQAGGEEAEDAKADKRRGGCFLWELE